MVNILMPFVLMLLLMSTFSDVSVCSQFAVQTIPLASLYGTCGTCGGRRCVCGGCSTCNTCIC